MSRVVLPDPGRRIDLPRVGPVPRPLEVDADVSGLRQLSMRAYAFRRGDVVDGEAEADEVLVVLLRGTVSFEVAPATTVPSDAAPAGWDRVSRADPFAHPPRGFYLPPRYAYRLKVHEQADVAYARARVPGGKPPRILQPTADADEPLARPDDTEMLGARVRTVPASETARETTRHETIVHVRLEDPRQNGRAVVERDAARDAHVLVDGCALALPGGVAFDVSAPSGGRLQMTIVTATPGDAG